MDFVRELRDTALRLLGVILIGAAIGIPIGAVMLARTDLPSHSRELPTVAMTPEPLTVLPESAPSVSPKPPPALDQTGASKALGMALIAAIGALFPVSYLYRAILGSGKASKPRKYAARASVSSLPFFMVAIDALLRGITPGLQGSASLPAALFSADVLAQFDSAAGRIIGLGLWAVIITGTAFAWGRFIENPDHVAAISNGERTSAPGFQRSSLWVLPAIGTLALLGYCSSPHKAASSDGCRVEWDGRANPTVCD